MADPTLPQKTKDIGNDWVGVVLGIIAAFALLGLVGCCCFRGPFVAAAPIDCEQEPDPKNVREYARWKRECEERQRPTTNKLSLAFSDADITKYHAVAS
ncbi:MAG: hypothetical protein CMB11_07855 [Euryarchaeota archaeon]|nr:hypothetical protein [Euryarchaeota archaeon]